MILGIYGYHDAGKTELIEKLIGELTSKGYGVVTVKNIPREFSIDTEGKDTWKYKKAGSEVVVASSLNETALIFNRNMRLDEIFNRSGGYDVILVEGHKKAPIPKIAVGDIKKERNTIFRYKNNLDEILEFIEGGVQMERNKEFSGVTIEVDGEEIPANRFVQKIFANVIYGMVSSLTGVGDTKDIKIEVKR